MSRKYTLITAIVLGIIGGALYASFFSKEKLIEDILTTEEQLYNITVWERRADGTTTSLIIANPGDEAHTQLQHLLHTWEVKRDFFRVVRDARDFKGTDTQASTYEIAIALDEAFHHSISIFIEENKLHMLGKDYTLVTGDIADILALEQN